MLSLERFVFLNPVLVSIFGLKTQVGDDEFGRMLADILRLNNVDNSGMRFDHSARTALAFVTLRADGEREFLFFRHPSADMLLSESELDKNLIQKVDFPPPLIHIFSEIKSTDFCCLITGQDLSLRFYQFD